MRSNFCPNLCNYFDKRQQKSRSPGFRLNTSHSKAIRTGYRKVAGHTVPGKRVIFAKHFHIFMWRNRPHQITDILTTRTKNINCFLQKFSSSDFLKPTRRKRRTTLIFLAALIKWIVVCYCNQCCTGNPTSLFWQSVI